ncbi:cell division protein FtsL [Azospirillum griseum]|uniref:Periplasmic protein TonB n=1 Tax=Azospirillum griseum TaxID=2496639 RepID=A0A3S0KXL4_9PROT|nr:hypothetical protein [Azospirillum griseum]RTR19164.1 hypothetical protein EJ903_14140 [Azospirillum griseum]
MKGKTWLFWGGLIAAAGAVLFQTSYDVQDLEEKLAGLNRKIVTEQESIQVLRAEWSYLNDPAKLEELARAHLALQPTEARQFVALDSLPMRPAQAPDAAPQPLPLPGRGVNPALPASVVPVAARAPSAPAPIATARLAAPVPAQAPQPVNTARVPAPTPKLSMDKALEKTPVIVPAALPVAPTVKSAPIKPSTLIPAAAKAPPAPAPAAPVAAPAPTAAPQPVPAALPPGKMAPNAPLPPMNRPTDIANRPIPPAPSAGKTQASAPQPKATDSLGLLVARLGANR